MKQKKALIVTTVSGFVPQFEMNNVQILQEMGYEVHYASNFQNVSFGTDNSRLDGTGIVRHQVDFARSPFQWKENSNACRQLKELFREQHFELVHCHTPVGAALARVMARPYRKQGTKVIYTAHGFHFYKDAPLQYWLLFYPVERFLARYTDVLITLNEEDFERAKRFCRRKKTQVERISGVGIDTAYFAGETLKLGEREGIRRNTRESLGVSEDTKVFLSVGELIPRKNHTEVIECFRTYMLKEKFAKVHDKKFAGRLGTVFESMGQTPWHYFICGQGVLKEDLQKQIDESGLSEQITLLGYRTDIRELLYASDVFVFPSRQEGLPVALMEAAAAGLELVATDIRGNREIVKKGHSGIHEFDVHQIKTRMYQIYKELGK